MLFKQTQLFQLDKHLTKSFLTTLDEKLSTYAFQPCLPSMPQSAGFIPPITAEDDTSLVRLVNGFAIICLQIEEKILPATVIQQHLAEAAAEMESTQQRKLRQKEKMALKDDILTSLMPRAFSKFTKIYAYIDLTNHWLVLGTTNPKKTEQFISIFRKSVSDDIHPIVIDHLDVILTGWLKSQPYTAAFAIEKSCVLQDPKQENRVIRCKQQDLFAPGIQALIQDGCHAVQLALNWNDRVSFTLASNFSFTNIQFQDELLKELSALEAETAMQQFAADMFMMTGTFATLFPALLEALLPNKNVTHDKNATRAEVETSPA